MISRSYLAGGIERVDDDVLSDNDKKRFLNVAKDDYWVKRNYDKVLQRIKMELENDYPNNSEPAANEVALGEEGAVRAQPHTDTDTDTNTRVKMTSP